jgi:phosphoribosyl-AMP cyclohydrolase/phosphoribosyl-ATP pyrophosphohydrolase/phosphoribosyl-AMP cyclohydrolase
VKDIEKAALAPEDVKFNDQGLIPCIVQDAETMHVLMMAWMNAESLSLSIEQRTTWFYSRSRQKLWHKGEESGNTQQLVSLHYDCDADTLLALVRPQGPACHTGAYTCFYRSFEVPGSDAIRDNSASESAGRGMTDRMGIRVIEQSPTRVRMDLPVLPGVLQPVGFLHGGATITLLESCASLASWLGSDLETEYSFGTHVDVKHVNAVRSGVVHGTAELDQVDDLGERGRKETWRVEATDDGGATVSLGTVTTRVVSKRYFANR